MCVGRALEVALSGGQINSLGREVCTGAENMIAIMNQGFKRSISEIPKNYINFL